MKQIIKRFIVICLVVINVLYCNVFLMAANMKKVKIESTDYRFEKSPSELFSGKFLLIGDSYAVLMVKNTIEDYNYVVHAGYNINKIYFELLPLIKSNEFEYAFLFLGPNDFMEQSDPKNFTFVLGLVTNILKSKGIKPILTDYVEPHYDYKLHTGLVDAQYNYKLYDNAIKEIIVGQDLLYVPFEDLFRSFGYRSELDLVHPNDQVYEHLLNRIVAKINENKK